MKTFSLILAALCLLSSCKEEITNVVSDNNTAQRHAVQRIVALIPDSAAVGDTVLILMANNKPNSYHIIKLADSVNIPVVRTSHDSIVVIVPSNAISGTLSVSSDTVVRSSKPLTIISGDVILNPSASREVAWGNMLAVWGRHFPLNANPRQLIFAPNIAVNILNVTRNTLSCIVPEGAREGALRLVLGNKTYTVPGIYTGPAMMIESISPQSLTTGKSFVIKGRGLPAQKDSLHVYFSNGQEAIVDSVAAPSAIYCRVPSYAASGAVRVQNGSKSCWSLASVEVSPLVEEEIVWSELIEITAEATSIPALDVNDGSVGRFSYSLTAKKLDPGSFWLTETSDSALKFSFSQYSNGGYIQSGSLKEIRISFDSASRTLYSISASYNSGENWTNGLWGGGGSRGEGAGFSLRTNARLSFTSPKIIELFLRGSDLAGITGGNSKSNSSTDSQGHTTGSKSGYSVGEYPMDANAVVHLRLVFQ